MSAFLRTFHRHSDLFFWTLFVGTGLGIYLVQQWLHKRERTRRNALAEAERAREKAEHDSEEARATAEREQRHNERLAFLKSSKRMQATVVFRFQLGVEAEGPRLQMRLTVHAPDGPYDVELEETIDFVDAHRFDEGSTIDVFANPNDRSRVIL